MRVAPLRFPDRRRMQSRLPWLLLDALLLVVGSPAACSDDAALAVPCANIPIGGCPLSRGVACEDPACEAVYACRAGNVWELDHRCPSRAGVDADAARDAPGREDAPTLLDAGTDAPPGASGGPGCAQLQLPDCSLGFALACPSGCCGCEDLFVCQGGGWSFWSTCGKP
jgi:hypothetical protein